MILYSKLPQWFIIILSIVAASICVTIAKYEHLRKLQRQNSKNFHFKAEVISLCTDLKFSAIPLAGRELRALIIDLLSIAENRRIVILGVSREQLLTLRLDQLIDLLSNL